MTIETEVAALTTATTSLLSAVNVKKAVLDASVANATTQAATAVANAATATTQNAAANTQAQAAASSAASASTSKDLAIAAWGASMSPAETLPAISKTLHTGAIVKSIIYDTGKDSDGGAWRKRCTDKSWYTETICTGQWRSQLSNLAAAWAVVGAAVGDFYQHTTDGKYYMIGGTSGAPTQTEVFRGNTREFPEQVAIVAEFGRVVIYDLTQIGTPMWMVFICYGVRAITVRIGELWHGGSSGVQSFNFISERCEYWAAANHLLTSVNISTRNISPTYSNIGSGMSSDDVNDIAITVLSNAPIDPATGLPVPTVFAGTARGLSSITNAGTVVNSTATTSVVSVDVDGNLLKAMRSDGTVALYDDVATIGVVPSTTLSASTIPSLLGTASKASIRSKGSSAGLTLIKRNQAMQAKSIVAYITNAYNSGWQVGDSRMAALADTVAETITESGELVTNGTNPTTTAGWNAIAGTIAIVGGEIELTATVNVNYAIFSVPVVAGKSYTLTASAYRKQASGSVSFGVQGAVYSPPSTADTLQQLACFTVIAVSNTLSVAIRFDTITVGDKAAFNFVSVKLATPDRSVKSNGLVINGSLVKTPVAAGAQLVAYSGFSAANYLEQPYNANLDFGTGDFSVMGWVKHSAAAPVLLFIRSEAGLAGPTISLQVVESGAAYISTGATGGPGWVSAVSAPGAVAEGVWSHVAGIRFNGYLYVYVNGLFSTGGWQPASPMNLDSVTATVRSGYRHDGFVGGGMVALLRASATAPSADQIAHIYRTELPLFQPNAKCTIDGTSTAVTALAYDDTTDVLHVGTSWGRSAFRDLVRVESEISAVGGITSISANQGAIITSGYASGRYYQPAMQLRDELRRKEEARKALGKVPVFFYYDAIGAQVGFVLPKGYTTKAVYAAGILKTPGATKAYLVNTDGFAETVSFAVAPGNTTEISIMAVRSN